MTSGAIAVIAILLATSLIPAAGARADQVDCEPRGAALVGVSRDLVDAFQPHLRLHVETLCVANDVTGSGTPLPADGCTATAYALAAHRWIAPYSAKIDARGSGLAEGDVLRAFESGATVWDDAAQADIFGAFSLGGSGASAGTRDGTNQMGFRSLGATNVLARTYTWYNGRGEAIESDAVYNTYYRFSASGASTANDLQSVAAHEMGHTFGLGHAPTVSANTCLTMYPSLPRGSTYARTLGGGDLAGIQAKYGAAPSPTPAPAPAPTPTLQATFTPHAANNWWVEVRVSADKPLASVTASVDGGAPVVLTYRSWGTWAASFYVPTGSTVRFVATSTEGATAASGGYAWPSMAPI